LSVLTDEGRKFVYVVNEKDVAENRPVVVGPLQEDGLQAVKEGLPGPVCRRPSRHNAPATVGAEHRLTTRTPSPTDHAVEIRVQRPSGRFD
jgi:hypothetical protein